MQLEKDEAENAVIMSSTGCQNLYVSKKKKPLLLLNFLLIFDKIDTNY